MKHNQLTIKKFIQCVNEKKYAAADKYLKAAVEGVLLKKMEKVKQSNLSKQ